MAARPRPTLRSVQTPTTPAPLKSSQAPNLSYPFLADSPSHFLQPKDGAVKLKVKSGVTPEARSRVGAGLGGLRPVTPRPVKRVLATPGLDAQTPNTGLGRSRLGRGMTPSSSEESMSMMLGSRSITETEDVEEALGESEAVLVTVR